MFVLAFSLKLEGEAAFASGLDAGAQQNQRALGRDLGGDGELGEFEFAIAYLFRGLFQYALDLTQKQVHVVSQDLNLQFPRATSSGDDGICGPDENGVIIAHLTLSFVPA